MKALSAIWIGCLLLAGCGRTAEPEPAKEAAQLVAQSAAGVELDAGQVQKLGIASTPATAATFVPQVSGYAVVVSHDAIAQNLAEVQTANAAVRQSRAALARVRGLAHTPGAFSAETQESAERQALADEASLALARRKLSAMWGAASPWVENETSAVLRSVANGKIKLIRASFPLGALTSGETGTLLFARFDAEDSATRWKSAATWAAPADAAIPGRSLFALLSSGDVAEGERLEAWAPQGAALTGVLVPQAAVVVSDGRYWCYVEHQPGRFQRRPLDASRPMDAGYFVEHGIAIGERIVTAGAGWLLAHEMQPTAGAEAD